MDEDLLNNREYVLGLEMSRMIQEIQSGYIGYFDPVIGRWLRCNIVASILNKKRDYCRDLVLIGTFRLEVLPFGQVPDYIIHEFLNKKYFKTPNT